MTIGKRPVVPIDLGLAKAFLLQGARPVLVDTGYSRAAGRLLKTLATRGVMPQDLALILITHGHYDHCGGINALRSQTRSPVAIHRLDAGALRTGIGMPVSPRGAAGSVLRLFFPPNRKPRIEGFEPEVIIEDELDLREYGVEGKVISTPGHTPGSVSVIMESGEAIVSDLVGGSMLTAAVPVIAFWAWDEMMSRASIRKVLSYRPRIVHATHGGPFGPKALARKFG